MVMGKSEKMTENRGQRTEDREHPPGRWIDRYLAGFRHGRTMAEVDAYFEGLLGEIKGLQKELERTDDRGQ